MKRIILALMIILSLIISGCGGNNSQSQFTQVEKSIITENNKELEIKHIDGITIVQKNPKRIVILDYAILDIMQYLQVPSRDVATSRDLIPDYMADSCKQSYTITDVGNLKKVDIEAIYNFHPDLIIINGRQGKYYEQLSKIAPTINTSNAGKTYKENLFFNIELVAKLFDKELKAKLAENLIQKEIDEINSMSGINETGFIMFAVGNKIHALGPKSWLGALPYNTCHLKSVVTKQPEPIPGAPPPNGISFEFIRQTDPDYIIVIDRDAAVRLPNSPDRDLFFKKNELLKNIKAVKNNRIYFVDSQLWYLSGGGIQSTRLMLNDIKTAISN